MSDDNRYEEHTLLLNKISDQVTEQTKVISKLDKKVDLNIQKVQYELKSINKLDEHQNQLIDEHIQGVNGIKTWCDDHKAENEKRFQKLEEPRKWMEMTKKIILVIGAISAAAYTVLKLLAII